MADILIRGMEMPHDCPHCEFAAIGYASPMSSDCTLYCRAVDKFKDCATEIMKDKSYEEISQYDTRPDWCPLVPLPEGHGRLGDLETAEAILHNKAFDLAGTSAEYNALNWALRQIKALPTIIEADLKWKMKNCCCFSNTDQAEGGGEDG